MVVSAKAHYIMLISLITWMTSRKLRGDNCNEKIVMYALSSKPATRWKRSINVLRTIFTLSGRSAFELCGMEL